MTMQSPALAGPPGSRPKRSPQGEMRLQVLYRVLGVPWRHQPLQSCFWQERGGGGTSEVSHSLTSDSMPPVWCPGCKLRIPLIQGAATRTCQAVQGRAILNGKKTVFRYTVFPKKPAGTPCVQPWLVAVGGWGLAAIGGWQLATGGWWRLVVVGGCWWLVIGGWWRLVVVGGWRLVAAGGWLAVGGGRWLVGVGG